jgi:hypothetical protein
MIITTILFGSIKMPFKSKSQLRTCYGRRTEPRGARSKETWNCDQWLRETKSICCLPEKKGIPTKSRCLRNGERIKGKVQTGPRGGRFFIITEKDSRGRKICEVKVYLPRKR